MPGDAGGSVNKSSLLMITAVFAKNKKISCFVTCARGGQIKNLLYAAMLFREYRVKTRREIPCMFLHIRAGS